MFDSNLQGEGDDVNSDAAARPASELQDHGTTQTISGDRNAQSRLETRSKRARAIPKRNSTANRLLKELASFNEEPKAKVAMTQDNIEIPGVWRTRYTQKILNHKDETRPPSPPKNLNIRQMINNQVLPKNRSKDHNTWAAAGVPVTFPLDDTTESSDHTQAVSEVSLEGSSDSVDEAGVDSTYKRKRRAASPSQRKSKKSRPAQPNRKAGPGKMDLVRTYKEEERKIDVLYEEWTAKKSKQLQSALTCVLANG